MYSKNSEENQGFLGQFFALTVLICYTKIRNHHKRVHIMVEPKQSLSGTVSAIRTYSHLKSGSSKVSVGLQNYSCRPITVKAKSTVATISAANDSGENSSKRIRREYFRGGDKEKCPQN